MIIKQLLLIYLNRQYLTDVKISILYSSTVILIHMLGIKRQNKNDMLRFTTTTPFGENSSKLDLQNVRPLIELKGSEKLKEGVIKGKSALITGDALKLAGFSLPCFFDGDITELDKADSVIYLVLPEGEYEISSKLSSEKIYMLDLKK